VGLGLILGDNNGKLKKIYKIKCSNLPNKSKRSISEEYNKLTATKHKA
jgi:hypothetical protein